MIRRRCLKFGANTPWYRVRWGAGTRHRASSLRERHFRGDEAGDKVHRVEHDMSGPVTEGVLESIHDLPAVIDREAFVRECWAGDVAAQAFERVPLMGSAARADPRLHHSGGAMEGESRELSDAGVGRRPAWTRRCAGSGPCAGVRAGGDAVVDGGTEELLESVVGFEVEGGGLVVADQQSLPFEGAGDAGGDGAQQALEFRLGRGAATVQAGPFIVERVDAIHEEHVQVDVDVQRRAESLDEGDGSGTRTGATRNPARRMRNVEIAR